MSNLHAEDELHRQIAAEQVQRALQQDGPLWRPETEIVPTPEVAKAIHLAVAGTFCGEEKIRTNSLLWQCARAISGLFPDFYQRKLWEAQRQPSFALPMGKSCR